MQGLVPQTLLWDSGVFCSRAVREAQLIFKTIKNAQFIAICSSSILAETLCLSSPFSGQSREKRSVSEKRTSLPRDELEPSTNSDKLSVFGIIALSAQVQGVVAAYGEFLWNNSNIKGIRSMSSCRLDDQYPHE